MTIHHPTRVLARVALPRRLHTELVYRVPPELTRYAIPGCRVIVPLRGRPVPGHVTALIDEHSGEVKDVLDVAEPAPSLPDDVWRLCRWIADYYAAPLGEVLAAASAPMLSPRFRPVLGCATRELDERSAEIHRVIAERPRSIAAIRRAVGPGRVLAVLLDLVRAGAVEMLEPRRGRSPQPQPGAAAGAPPLTDQQRAATDRILAAIGTFAPIVLEGVTASGKTRVYVEAIRAALERGQTALLLVPEIAMTFLLEDELAGVAHPFCTLHSQLSPAERGRRYADIRAGRYGLVVGTRSAVFAPLPRLGLIVVDEEHDPAYKQDERARYNGRDAAVMRAKFLGIPVILGSATPSLETYSLGMSGRYTLVRMPERLPGRALPSARVLDMRGSGETLVAEELRRAVLERLERGEQAILLLNRRGYAPSLICNSCGAVMRCDDCDVSMVYHREQDCFLCHYCGARRARPETCRACGEAGCLFLAGHGTEKALETVQQMFAGFGVERLDSDVATSPSRTRSLLERFRRGEIHVLVGTQMLAKGHHFPRVTLVGVLSLDHLLGMPDFRAAERAFQLITQVAGRSGRGEAAGEVIIQTRYPRNYALLAGCQQDYGRFYREEIRYRSTLGYPPFSGLVLVTCRDLDRVRVARRGRDLGAFLQSCARPKVEVIGPVSAPMARIRRQWRVHLLLKGDRASLRETLRIARHTIEVRKHKFGDYVIDVDPLDLM